MACSHCGRKRGHHLRCDTLRPRRPRPGRSRRPAPTTAADVLAWIREGVLAGGDNPAGASAEHDQAADELCFDGGIWRITVERLK